jgi:hypothetical protein
MPHPSYFPCSITLATLKEEHRVRVFENRVLRRIFAPLRNRITGSWRKLHNEEFHDLYSSPNIIMVIKSRRMKKENLKGRDHLEDLGIDIYGNM